MKALVTLAVLGVAIGVRAQDPQRTRVVVEVTSVAGRSVFLNRGRGAGLSIGMRVTLTRPSAAPIDVTIRSVSTNSARAELIAGILPPPVGTRGEVWIEAEKDGATEPVTKPRRATDAPRHPPWQNPEGEFDDQNPLLAPALGSAPEERPVVWRGRVFGHLHASRDLNASPSSDYFLGRLGTDIEATNLFGAAGTLEFSLDLDRRGTDLADTGDKSDSRARLERLSYTYGDQTYSPYRVQLGRFFSSFVPEVGLLDGVEGVMRFEDGLSLGAFAGALPRPFPSHDTGEDVGAHVFFDYVSDAEHHFAWNVAFQKSWHHGDPDRDLILLRGSIRPAQDLYIWANAKLDIYTGSDTIKGSGIEPTETFTTLRYAPAGGIGGALSHSHYEWAELKRREYQNIPIELVQRARVDRISAELWAHLARGVKIRGRTNLWDDQDSDGTSWEIGTELDGIVEERTWVGLRVFQLDGTFSTGPGFGIDVRRSWDAMQLHAGFVQRNYDQRGFVTGTESFTSRSVRGGVSWFVERWQFDFDADYYFGDREDTISVGLFAQYAF